MSVTTKIATESARPSLVQNIVELYNALHVGGVYDSKGQLVTDGTHNELLDMFGSGESAQTTKGFKTKMQEQMTEMKMGKDSTVVTTRMRTSIYGDHSNRRYQP